MSAEPRKHRSISWGHQDATPYHQSAKFLLLQWSVSQPDVPEEPMSNRPNRLLLNLLSLHTHHPMDPHPMNRTGSPGDSIPWKRMEHAKKQKRRSSAEEVPA